YSAMPDEAEPQAVSQWHVARGGRIAFPRVEGDRLRWFLASIETLRPQPPWSILEPDPLIHSEISPNQVDAWIVPGLGFTQDGLRIGYGRGYYDRALAASTSTLKIGFAFSIQCVAKLPTASHDQRLAAVVHEEAFCIAAHR
ncbi:MAG: 5-formyltetrahydrofolate cyclo-ligase, partial [Myxococcota bacterium]